MPAQKITRPHTPEKLKNFGTDALEYYAQAAQVPARGNIVVHSRSLQPCKTCLTSGRRDYYKLPLITSGTGRLTLGARRYKTGQSPHLFRVS